MSTATRRAAGRAAALAGREWEITLKRWHTAYRRAGLACVIDVHPRTKRIEHVGGGRFEGVQDRAGPPDFMGTIATGRAVVFDAKRCDGSRWALSQVERHQARDLEAFAALDAAAFIALSFAGRGWVLPWAERDGKGIGERYWTAAEGRAARGAASLTESDLFDLGLPMDDDGWLGAVLHWWRPR